jgi:hypothetical protein
MISRPKTVKGGRNRHLLPFVLVVVATASVSQIDAQAPAPAGQSQAFDPHDISGYWELSPYDRGVPPADLTEAARAKMADARDQDLISKRYCRPLGVPAMMDPGRPLSITQGRYEVLITAPVNTTHRHLLFRGHHTDPEIYDPSSAGESIAHWEGETLVVDTNGFHDKYGWMLIPGGGYRTAESHLVERYKLLKNGQVLSVTFTWTDPKVFATPHTYEFWYHRINGPHEERPGIGCNAWDPERSAFIERGFSPELQKKSDAALVKPGSARKQ